MNTSKLFVVIFYFICVYIFLQTYYYLDEIDNCPCFEKDGKYKVNVDFMKFFQVLEVLFLTVFLAIFLFITSSKTKILNKNKIPNMNVLTILPMIVLLGISGYMSYNVLNLYYNIKEDCKCVDSWYRYFLYYEGAMSFVSVLRIVGSILFLAIFFIAYIVTNKHIKK